MRLIARLELLLAACSLAVLCGCIPTPRPLTGDPSSNTTSSTPLDESFEFDESDRNLSKAEFDLALPSTTQAIPLPVDDVPVQLADDPQASSDSDSPGVRQRVNHPTEEHKHVHPPSAAADGSETNQGRRSDGDDPQAPLIIPQAAAKASDGPLNNGREPAAQPLPAGERKVVATTDNGPLNDGRGDAPDPAAAPVQPEPASAPVVKPTPSKATLADLAESIQTLDKDGDGQLGLYEWPREKLSEFKTLDSNQDGFLTPAELVAGEKKATAAKEEAEAKAAAAADKAKSTDDKEREQASPDAKPIEAAPENSPPTAPDDQTPAAETTDKEKAAAEPATQGS